MFGRRRRVNLVDTPALDSFFDRLDHMNRERLMAMRAAWRSTSRETHEEAWSSVQAIGVSEGLTEEIERVRRKALNWATRGSGVVPYYRVADDDVNWLQVKMEASEAIVDAALATALGSRLDSHSRDVLIEPWLRATVAGGSGA